MKPKIKATHFGSITIADQEFDHDVIIQLDGQVRKRKKKLSKAVYGTSHQVSLEEARFIFEDGTETLIIGNGQQGYLFLSDEARDFFKSKGCEVNILKTPAAIEAWNHAKGKVIGLFHITC